MTFSSKATPPALSRAARRVAAAIAQASGRLAVAAAFVGAGLLASCGGGTSQLDPFVPKRLLAFGDESSALVQGGRNYSVNGLDTNGQFDCTLSQIWVQSLASIYGFTFAECNPNFVSFPQARTLAFAGAKVADVAAQVEAQVAAGGFRDKDLATMLVGTNDLLELYGQYPSLSEDILIAEAGARGRRLAQVVNRLVDLGAKIIVSDLPDLGLTPYARKQAALGLGGTDRVALMTRLTTAFNEQLGVSVLLDGRYVGLVQAQLRFAAVGRSPASFGLSNITDGVCTTAPPDCTTATLLPDASAGQYLWSDDTRLGPAGHTQLATLAIDRARRNPF